MTLLPELFRSFAEYRMIAYAMALIIVMLLRPQGLLGLKELWEVEWRQVGRSIVTAPQRLVRWSIALPARVRTDFVAWRTRREEDRS